MTPWCWQDTVQAFCAWNAWTWHLSWGTECVGRILVLPRPPSFHRLSYHIPPEVFRVLWIGLWACWVNIQNIRIHLCAVLLMSFLRGKPGNPDVTESHYSKHVMSLCCFKESHYQWVIFLSDSEGLLPFSSPLFSCREFVSWFSLVFSVSLIGFWPLYRMELFGILAGRSGSRL